MSQPTWLCTIASDELEVLAAAIRARLRGLLREVYLEAFLGGIVIRGRAYTYHVKQLAQHEVLRRGRRIVANEIVVERLSFAGACRS